MNALIVDDEEPARRALRRFLAGHPAITNIAEAIHGVDALEQIAAARPDVLFLDVEKPSLSGFDLLAQLPVAPPVVFSTAFDAYAVRPFEANAVDYLLKPVQPAALARALDRLATRIPAPDLFRKLQAALGQPAPIKLAARRGQRIVLLNRREILFAQAEDRLVFLHTATEKLLTDRTIAELETLLPATEFVRIHRNALVQLEAIREIFPWLSAGAWRVRLHNGVELDVSRERARELRAAFGF